MSGSLSTSARIRSRTRSRSSTVNKARATLRGSRGVLDLAERPVCGDPLTDTAPQGNVQVCAAGSHPRENAGVVIAVWNRVDVDTADNVTARTFPHRVGEARTPPEVGGVALEIAEVLLQRHLARPGTLFPARRGVDVLHRRRPGAVVLLVVLRPQRLERERWSFEP